MILTETYIKKLIRQVLKENENKMELRVKKAIDTLNVINQGYQPQPNDIPSIIALIQELDSKANPKENPSNT